MIRFRTLTVILINFIVFISFAQNNEQRNINVTITINGEIALNLSDVKLKLPDNNYYKNGIDYVPGNLLLSKEMYESILNSEKNGYYFCFDYVVDSNKDTIDHYEISLEKIISKISNSNHYFCIIEVFNLKDKKYRKKYNPISSEKKYNYNLIFPHYSIIQGLK